MWLFLAELQAAFWFAGGTRRVPQVWVKFRQIEQVSGVLRWHRVPIWILCVAVGMRLLGFGGCGKIVREGDWERFACTSRDIGSHLDMPMRRCL